MMLASVVGSVLSRGGQRWVSVAEDGGPICDCTLGAIIRVYEKAGRAKYAFTCLDGQSSTTAS